MSSRHKRKAKLSRSERFYQMHVWVIESPAWKATTVYERALYWELKQRYNGGNNGDIALSHREAQAALNCSNVPVIKAFNGLIQKGFIRAAQVGSFHWKKGGGAGGRSTRWILTEYPTDIPDRALSADKDFMRWRPGSEKKSRYDVVTPMVCSRHTMKAGVV